MRVFTNVGMHICMQNVIKIYHVDEELWSFSLTGNGRTDSQSDNSVDRRVVQSLANMKAS